ncbi:alpha/beta hydrolase family protein [Nonomuraea sp. NPDC050556]|uniref:alpha/beta hydrolase family protein n=1 Tax=Nonomuraea sp. NPDC050556 TaxID=3364369 RepID=UPI0037A86D0E
MRAATRALTIDSGGELLLGVLYLPSGPGPHPVVVLMHGFPGNEANADLAQALRTAGYACLLFHYRGSWGVGGDWSWANALEDAARVTRAVLAMDELDPERVALLGHSMGGFAALMTAADEPRVRAVVSVSGFDFGAVTGADGYARERYVEAFSAELLPLRGATGEGLVAEMEAAGQAWNLEALAPRLTGRALLLIGTQLDEVTPPAVHHRPLVAAFDGAEHHEWPTDHALSDHRPQLIACVRDFLDRRLR